MGICPKIYRRPTQGILAPPGQALCDFIHIVRRRGLDPAALVTFRGLAGIAKRQLSSLLKRYPPVVAETVRQITCWKE